MGFTATEKILARVSGRPGVRAGDDVQARPDFVLFYAAAGYSELYLDTLGEELGLNRVADPDRLAIFIDHNIPATTAKNEAMHEATRRWCADQGVQLFERRGIGHLVASEAGYATPGAFVVHFDGHVSQLGTFGTLAMGIRFNILQALAEPAVDLRVPGTTRIDFTGRLPHGVMARDVLHHLVGKLGSNSCNQTVMELGGPGLDEFSLGDLQSITGLAMFTGAVSAFVNPTAAALDYTRGRSRKRLDPVWSDADAVYAAHHSVELSEIEPVIVIPPSPANTRRLADYVGLEVQTGYIGSCASGRIEDLRVAAKILSGRTIKPGFALNIVPSSNEIMAQAAREGLVGPLIEAGAFVSSPTCSYCYGALGGMLPGQRAVSTGTLNVRGRMGSTEAEIYICNAAAVAAAALEGRVADPRAYL